MNLSKQEQLLYNDIVSKLSSQLNEASVSDIKDTLLNIKKNWRNYSFALLTALMLNPSTSSAMSKYIPTTYKEISNVVNRDKEKGTKTIDFSQNFTSGKTTLENSPELIKSLQDLKAWSKDKKLTKYKVKIYASESQVPNQSPYRTPGSLARARAKVIEDLLNKLGFPNIEIETQIGKTPYKQGDDPNDKRFQQEQSVRLEIILNTKEICGLKQFSGGNIQGSESNNYITYEEEISGNGDIKLKTGSIPDRIVIKDESGKINFDSGYITTEKHKYPEWKYVPLYVKQLTQLNIKKNESVQGEKIMKIKVNSFEQLLNHLLVTPDSYKPNKFKETGLAIQELKQMFDSGVREFVLYSLSSNPTIIPFNESNGDSTIIVYSPVEQTGFELIGSCK